MDHVKFADKVAGILGYRNIRFLELSEDTSFGYLKNVNVSKHWPFFVNSCLFEVNLNLYL